MLLGALALDLLPIAASYHRGPRRCRTGPTEPSLHCHTRLGSCQRDGNGRQM